jgi:hypothetical protein
MISEKVGVVASAGCGAIRCDTRRPHDKHDPEKWVPVFGKDHAQIKSESGMTIRRKVIPL